MKRPTIDGQCFSIEEMDDLEDELLEELRVEDGLEVALTIDHLSNGFVTKESQAYELLLDQESTFAMETQSESVMNELEAKKVEVVQNEDSTVNEDDWSELKAPKVDLKELLSGLRVLKRCEEANRVLNWEKCHLMVQEGIALDHKISKKGIGVDKAKISVMVNLGPPKTVKDIRAFLGHAGFYRRFIRDFSKIARPLTRLLCKAVEFLFDEECMNAFLELKRALVSAPIVHAPDWDLPFEIMCDASDYAVGAVLGQRKDTRTHVIYHAKDITPEAVTTPLDDAPSSV